MNFVLGFVPLALIALIVGAVWSIVRDNNTMANDADAIYFNRYRARYWQHLPKRARKKTIH